MPTSLMARRPISGCAARFSETAYPTILFHMFILFRAPYFCRCSPRFGFSAAATAMVGSRLANGGWADLSSAALIQLYQLGRVFVRSRNGISQSGRARASARFDGSGCRGENWRAIPGRDRQRPRVASARPGTSPVVHVLTGLEGPVRDEVQGSLTALNHGRPHPPSRYFLGSVSPAAAFPSSPGQGIDDEALLRGTRRHSTSCR